jgi:hypothetical protein
MIIDRYRDDDDAGQSEEARREHWNDEEQAPWNDRERFQMATSGKL